MAKSAVSKRLGALAVTALLLSAGICQATRLEHVASPSRSAPVSDYQGSVPADRLAVIIANYGYADADTPPIQVRRDAEALANVLRKDSFVADLVENATHADMITAIERLKTRVRPNSIVFLYFGGYGVQSRDHDYMIPEDAKIWRESDVRRDGLSVERVLSDLKESGPRIQIAVIDASRRNPYERRFRSYSHGLSPIQMTGDAIVLSSTAPDQVVDDFDTDDNPFMVALIHEMDSSPHPINQVFEDTRAAVAARTENRQLPTLSSTLREAVTLDSPPSETPISSATPAENRRRG
jgi:uncharacterized caspase-like protein